MYRNLLRIRGNELELATWHKTDLKPGLDGFRTRGEGYGLVEELVYDPLSVEAARHVLGAELGFEDVGRLKNAQVAARLGEQLHDGVMRIGAPRASGVLFPSSGAIEEKVEAQSARGAGSTPQEQRKAWIKIKVVDDETDRPISGVMLKVTLPGGSEVFRQTDPQGVMIEKIDPGTCNVSSSFGGVTRYETLGFVRMGKLDSKPALTPEQQREQDSRAIGGACIANVKEHKVKKGESILSLAKANGMQWQELAIFNWGTSVPDEINVHLRDEVGCTKKTADGFNYMFDDSDDPGIMYIPKVWEEKGLKTEQEHVIRVKPPKGGTMLTFQLVEEDTELLLPHHAYTIYNAQGSEISRGETDDDAFGRARVPGPGEYLVSPGTTERFSVSGIAFDRAVLSPLANAAVTVTAGGAAPRQVTTGGGGELNVADLPKGTVNFEHKGAEFALFVDRDIADAIVFLSATPAEAQEPESEETWEDLVHPPEEDETGGDPAPGIDPDDF